MAVTLKDLAKALNLSISTVNAALHNRLDISAATRQRVWDKVREMNYRPNLVARSLVTRKTQVIGVVVPDLSRSFFTEVTKGIDEVASTGGYNLLLCNTGEDPAREDKQVLTLVGKQVDGLILGSAHPPGSTKIQEELSLFGIPCVLIDRYFKNLHFVGGDDVMIGYTATEHLINQGYHKIAHLRGPNVSTALGRLQGYRNALRAHGIKAPNEYVVEAHFHEEAGGSEALETLLRLPSPPDAIFAASDPIAIGALECALGRGLRVPEDLGVVGVGNHRYGQYLRVPLTTLDQNRLEIGRRAASLVVNLIDGKSPSRPQVLLFKPKLIVRESTLRSAIPHNLATTYPRSRRVK